MAKKECIQILSANIQGALHRSKNMPCQDCYASKINKNKLIAVVSDGAGSAKYGKIGARIVCDTLCDLLIRSDLKNIRRDVKNALRVARQKLILHRLNKNKSTAGIMDFSATVVGVFCIKNQGVFFHIGDGAGLAFYEGQSDNFVISEPANGAFSCETFFYTMNDWQDNLRFTFFENANRIILMTDGVTDFVFADDFYKIRQKFLFPIINYLEQETNKVSAQKALSNTLNDTRAQRINADDKTLLWVKMP
ncbi:MAG: protein phosphatase 2C domain-containing protein [Alphaproteobacteria bacterium]|nr:protein phosphatase 2C domain-containing protein [Alphaproteobacteria bacterium]